MRTTNIRRVFIIAGILSLLLSYLGVWIQFINDPVERTGSDFISLYTAGRIAQRSGPASVYRPALQQQIQQEEVGFPLAPGQVLLFNHPPFMIALGQAIVRGNYVASFYRWVCLLILLYLADILLLSQTLKRAGIDRGSILVAGIGAFLFLPVFFSLMNGQDTALLLLGAAIWMYGLISGREHAAGLGLSLTTVRPHIALLLAIPLLFRYRKAFLGFLLGSGILAVFSVLIIGMNGVREYINILLLSAGGEWFGMKESAMVNLLGMLARLAPQLSAGTVRLVGWAVYGLALAAMCILWFKARDLEHGLIGLSVILTLFFVPHLHFHDLALLLIPFYDLLRQNEKTGILRTPVALTAPIAFSLLLLVSNLSPYLAYTTPYLIMLALAVYPYLARSGTPLTALHRS